jgi:hypothetical protein
MNLPEPSKDPASDNAASLNKEIALELARQIAAVGGDPLEALNSGTFKPGDVNDPTAAGNTCDDPNDQRGCIFTQNLLVPDATDEEILAAVGGGQSGVNNTSTGNDNIGNDNTGNNSTSSTGNVNSNDGNSTDSNTDQGTEAGDSQNQNGYVSYMSRIST